MPVKKALIKIKAIFLAFVLLFASNTYAVTSHFCGSYLVDVSYVGKTKACGMEMSSDDDCSSQPKFEKNCCSQTTQLLESDVENFTVKITQDSISTNFIFAFVETYIDLYSTTQKEYEFLKNNAPPDIEQDYQVLFETFLI